MAAAPKRTKAMAVPSDEPAPPRRQKPSEDPRLVLSVKLPHSLLQVLRTAAFHEERTRQDIVEEGLRHVLAELGYLK